MEGTVDMEGMVVGMVALALEDMEVVLEVGNNLVHLAQLRSYQMEH
jgi:hypothetical protein